MYVFKTHVSTGLQNANSSVHFKMYVLEWTLIPFMMFWKRMFSNQTLQKLVPLECSQTISSFFMAVCKTYILLAPFTHRMALSFWCDIQRPKRTSGHGQKLLNARSLLCGTCWGGGGVTKHTHGKLFCFELDAFVTHIHLSEYFSQCSSSQPETNQTWTRSKS